MAKKSAVSSNIAEEFYQISPEIYASFPKYRPPVDLFKYEENIASLYPFSKKGQRLTNEQIDGAIALCKEGNLFVSRKDLPIYMEHIVHQLDLVLLDQNFKNSEVSKILIRGLYMRYSEFAQQPVKPVFDLMYADLMVFTEYVWADKHRLRPFLPHLYTEKSDHGHHAVNTLMLGMWLFVQTQKEPSRRLFDALALGLLVHDIGMSKLPPHLLAKRSGLSKDEHEKTQKHPLVGVRVMQKLDVVEKETIQAIYEHHERLDGSGYPQKVSGTNVGIISKITAIADSLSAMIQERPFTEQVEIKTAVAKLFKEAGKYDPELLKVLLNGIVSGWFDPVDY